MLIKMHSTTYTFYNPLVYDYLVYLKFDHSIFSNSGIMKLKNNLNLFSQKDLENKFLNKNLPVIRVGDTIKLGVSITEGNKERVQFTEGVIIAKKNSGLNATITLRRVMQGVGVERVYLLHSPKLKSVEVLRSSKVRRSKLYYLRLRFGKATRLQQRFD
jgi:large subunit ribosomal protein L19